MMQPPVTLATIAPDDILRRLVEGTATATGDAFFRALVEHLAGAMGVYAALVTEYLPEARAARALAFWSADGWIDGYEYEIEGTPCELVFRDRCFFHFPDRITERFPADADFRKMRIVSYMGSPILGAGGRVIGHLSVMDRKPLPVEPRLLALFKIFAARAAAERQRLVAERAVREREEKLARLVEGTTDAIVELDHALVVTQCNAATSTVFGCRREHVVGAAFTDLIAPASQDAFCSFASALASEGCGQRRSTWLRDGFHARRGDRSEFPAEASLSCSRTEKGTFFTVVLRNVEDRLRAAAQIRALAAETRELRAEIASLRGSAEIIGESPAIRKALRAVAHVAAAPSTVLLTGESGTGKEVFARAIHAASQRAGQPLVRVNCGAIPHDLIESEFFGHEKGAFTGATAQRIGRFGMADGGTLFLDEIGELPLALQPKLLRVLQEGEFEPVGSSRTRKVDVRLVAATNRDLRSEVEAGRFREDLYYRLNVFPIEIPPLRDRGDDILLLAEAFCHLIAREMGKPFAGLGEANRRHLMAYSWPGNVRELQNVLERALLCAQNDQTPDIAAALPHPRQAEPMRPPGAQASGSEDSTTILTDREIRSLERENMARALAACGWQISGAQGAARLLGLRPSTLTSRMKALGIRKTESVG